MVFISARHACAPLGNDLNDSVNTNVDRLSIPIVKTYEMIESFFAKILLLVRLSQSLQCVFFLGDGSFGRCFDLGKHKIRTSVRMSELFRGVLLKIEQVLGLSHAVRCRKKQRIS